MLNIKKALTELSNKMSELFTSLTVSVETLSTTSGGDVRLTRYGSLRVLHIGNPKTLSTGDNLIYTLNTKDRPKVPITLMLISPVSAISNGGTQLSLRATIQTNGEIRIYNYRSTEVNGNTNASADAAYIVSGGG